MMRLPGLEVQERASASALMRAFEEARTRNSISRFDRQLVQPSQANQLNAANPYARIRWGNALWTEFANRFGLTDEKRLPDVPLFWVTLVDMDCFTDCEATVIPVASMRKRLLRGLRGVSYLGMFDPAYYVNVAPGTRFGKRRGVNWHLHLLVWGVTRKEIKALAAELNKDGRRSLRSIMPKGLGAHWKQVTPDVLEVLFRYMVKWPQKAYRVGLRQRRNDRSRLLSNFKHNRGDLRKGERVTLFHLLKRLELQELTVAAREGVKLKRRALAKTRP